MEKYSETFLLASKSMTLTMTMTLNETKGNCKGMNS